MFSITRRFLGFFHSLAISDMQTAYLYHIQPKLPHPMAQIPFVTFICSSSSSSSFFFFYNQLGPVNSAFMHMNVGPSTGAWETYQQWSLSTYSRWATKNKSNNLCCLGGGVPLGLSDLGRYLMHGTEIVMTSNGIIVHSWRVPRSKLLFLKVGFF